MPNIMMKKMKEIIRDVSLKINTLSSRFYEIKDRKTFGESTKRSQNTDLENPLGRLPMWSRKASNISLKNNAKINRYLEFQGRRIKQAIKNNEINKAVLIWLLLLKNSKSYQIVLFNKAIPYWYWKFTEMESREILKRIINQCRKQNLWLTLRRFYILKSDGVRWRPIGSPDLPSRVIGRGLSDLIYNIFEKDLQSQQHGYRKGKGLHTAIFAIIQRLKMKPKIIYEFDLTAYFNRVKPIAVYEKLMEKSALLALYIYNILVKIKYNFKEIKPEEELTLIDNSGKVRKLVRRGLPQGLTISPILSTLALELETKDKWNEIIMYADDGVFIGNSWKKFEEWKKKKLRIGAEVNESKSGIVKDKFKFLGIEIDLKNKTVAYGYNKMYWDDPNLMNWLRTVISKYTQRNEKWRWEIKIGSYLNSVRVPKTYNIGDLPMILINSMKGMDYKGYRMFRLGLGIQDIPGSSSICLNLLIDDLKELKLAGISPFRKVFDTKVVKDSMNYQFDGDPGVGIVTEGNIEHFVFDPQILAEYTLPNLEKVTKVKKPWILKTVGSKQYRELIFKDKNWSWWTE